MKLLARAALSVLLVLGFVLMTTPGTAVADDKFRYSCYGLSCEGIDPDDTACINDARTIMSQHARTELTGEDIGLLELRYSPECKSNWVRFTPWFGIRTWFANKAGGGKARGLPWIWRQGVANSLQGMAGISSPWDIRTQTVWTKMVTADGTTCSSVSLFQLGSEDSGQLNYEDLGPYNAPCVS